MRKEKRSKKLKRKIAVALSGGVDSSVAAVLLKTKGYEIFGIHLGLWTANEESECRDGKFVCCGKETVEIVKEVCDRLQIPLFILDYRRYFKKTIVDYFLREYSIGRTPNPCVVCNQKLRFGKLLSKVLAIGANSLATGHYARIQQFKTKGQRTVNYHLLSGLDSQKDQSYFLYNLTQYQLTHILFPVGEFTKREVRQIARKFGLPTWERPESQDLCFFRQKEYGNFLRQHLKEEMRPGPIVNLEGEVLGQHEGLPFYTIGQRRKIKTKLNKPLYVIGIDQTNNTLMVGSRKEGEVERFMLSWVNWVNPDLKSHFKSRNLSCQVKVRYRGDLHDAQISQITEGRYLVEVQPAIFGVTPGQSAVFYKKLSHLEGYEVLGGGVIN